MSKCLICDEDITADNDSEEHLIGNAIGGRKKLPGFLCQKCNSTKGDTWDAELAKQLQPLCLLIGVERERGTSPCLDVITIAGERLTIKAEGPMSPSSPTFKATPDGNIEITARTTKEARRMLRGLKKKHPNIDVEATLAKAKVVETYPQGAVHHSLQISGPVAGRAIIKSCMAMSHAAGLDWQKCGSLSLT